MDTERASLADLKPHPMNAKTHDLVLIKSSLQEFGQIKPLCVSLKSGYLVAGHGTRQAMMLLGWTDADVWYLPDLEPDDELRLLAIDNHSADSPNDKGLMYELLSAIQDQRQGLIGTGFDDRYVERLAALRQSGAERTASLFAAANMEVDPQKPATFKVPMTQAQAEAVMEIVRRYAEANSMKPGAALYEIVSGSDVNN
jgi:ParB-like chromosome segregation protein Spo0J